MRIDGKENYFWIDSWLIEVCLLTRGMHCKNGTDESTNYQFPTQFFKHLVCSVFNFVIQAGALLF